MRQIIATSGGFAIEPRNKRLDRYILAQSSAEKPKICFIGTASGDSDHYIQRFYSFFTKEHCEAGHLDLFRGNILDPIDFLLSQDIIYVGGGNSRNMLAIWKDRGIDNILHQAYQNSILLCGISAGALCWFEQGLTDSIPGTYTAMDCLGLIKGSHCPFYNQEKKEAYQNLIKSGQIKPGIACDIGVGLHYKNEQLSDIISSRKKAKAYRFKVHEEQVEVNEMRTKYIQL